MTRYHRYVFMLGDFMFSRWLFRAIVFGSCAAELVRRLREAWGAP